MCVTYNKLKEDFVIYSFKAKICNTKTDLKVSKTLAVKHRNV